MMLITMKIQIQLKLIHNSIKAQIFAIFKPMRNQISNLFILTQIVIKISKKFSLQEYKIIKKYKSKAQVRERVKAQKYQILEI